MLFSPEKLRPPFEVALPNLREIAKWISYTLQFTLK
jgi:hypothetical protein